uniref:Uncharacterized protein n=1 Tax=Solanum lycopersicum TaxID=4081 RepID=A0A3Q7HWZ8_SOLLC
MKTLLFVICLIFICSWPGCSYGIQDVAKVHSLQREVINQMNMRKVLEVDVVVDYNGGGGANTAHTPGKGYPPKGANNAN